MGCGGHRVGTALPSRPSLSPGGVAPAARWPASAHPLPTFRTVLASVGRGVAGRTPCCSLTGDPTSGPADSHHAFRRAALGVWATGADNDLSNARPAGYR